MRKREKKKHRFVGRVRQPANALANACRVCVRVVCMQHECLSVCESAKCPAMIFCTFVLRNLKQAWSLSGKGKTPHNLLMLISSLHCTLATNLRLMLLSSPFVLLLLWWFFLFRAIRLLLHFHFVSFFSVFVCLSFTLCVCVCVCAYVIYLCIVWTTIQLGHRMADVQCLKVRCIWSFQWNAPFSTLDVIRAMAQSVHPTMNYLQFLQFPIKWPSIRSATNIQQRLCLQQ